MSKLLKNTLAILILSSFFSCTGSAQKEVVEDTAVVVPPVVPSDYFDYDIEVGAAATDNYLQLIEGKTVAVVANATSMVGEQHLIDLLLSKNIGVQKVFAPEHGFRGKQDAGEKVDDQVDSRTGLPIISLYGENKKPTAESLKGIDIVVFDIQDVGVRFYTYLSTLHYVMEACAEQDIPVVVLDRPNPNGFYIDGPVLETDFTSFVGLHPVPIVYGMTIGEYAQMINGQGWLDFEEPCDLSVVPCKNYTHKSLYELPVKPSPNLPTMTSIYLYPSLALFEGTVVSVGRGTDFPFEVVGHPGFEPGPFRFTPQPNAGAKYPKLEGKECKSLDLRDYGSFYSRRSKQMYLFWLKGFYDELSAEEIFFLENNFFNKLAGNKTLMKQIKDGLSEEEIRASWASDLEEFKKIRTKYLIYK